MGQIVVQDFLPATFLAAKFEKPPLVGIPYSLSCFARVEPPRKAHALELIDYLASNWDTQTWLLTLLLRTHKEGWGGGSASGGQVSHGRAEDLIVGDPPLIFYLKDEVGAETRLQLPDYGVYEVL